MDWLNLLSHTHIRKSSSAIHGDRTDFERDYDRIIFSKPFRRLQKKTQVFPLPEQDFIHTRLTHSLETSSVGRSLGMLAGQVILKQYPALLQDDFKPHDFAAIVAAAALGHDLGNPPFGHSGEDAISDFFKSADGQNLTKNLSSLQKLDLENFEGNAMGFRLLAYTLPGISSNIGGLNLTYAALGAYSKYPCEMMSTKLPGISGKKYGFFQSQKDLFVSIAETLGLKRKSNSAGSIAFHRHPLAFLVEAADDISYLLMDLEDGFNLKIVSEKQIQEIFTNLLTKGYHEQTYNNIQDPREKVAFLRALAISDLIEQTKTVFEEKLIDIVEGKYDKQLKDDIKKTKELAELRTFCQDNVYTYRKVLEIESAGFEIIGGLLKDFLFSLTGKTKKAEKIRSLLSKHYIVTPVDTPEQWYEAILHIVQFIAGMTDTFAIDTYRTIKGIRLPNY